MSICFFPLPIVIHDSYLEWMDPGNPGNPDDDE